MSRSIECVDADADTDADAVSEPVALSIVRSGRPGICLSFAALAAMCSAGLLLLLTSGWAEVKSLAFGPLAWGFIAVPFALLFAWRGLRQLMEPYLTLDNEHLVWHRAGKGGEDEVFPFASIETQVMEGGDLCLEVFEDEGAPPGYFRIPLCGVPRRQRELLARAVGGKVAAWERANPS